MTRLSSLVILPLLVAACGGPEPTTLSREDEPAAPVAEEPDCAPESVVVGGGGQRVGRGAGVYVRFGRAPEDLQLTVTGPSGKHTGDLYLDDGRLSFLPLSAYPAETEMTWSLRMCGNTFSQKFETGTLIATVDEQALEERFVGKTFALDLRASTWAEPWTGVEERLAYRFAGAFLLDVLGHGDGGLELGVAAALPDNAGGYERDLASVTQVFVVPFADNPYATLEVEALTLPTTHGEITLRDTLIGIGFGPDGLEDGWVLGTLDVGSDDGCTLVETATGVACGPCGAGATEGTCVPFEATNLFGLSL